MKSFIKEMIRNIEHEVQMENLRIEGLSTFGVDLKKRIKEHLKLFKSK